MQDRLALLKIGYDEALKDIGPGGIALLSCLEHESDTTRELSLVTDPPWAQRWHFQTEQTWLYNHFNKTFYCRALPITRPIYLMVKRLLRRYPPSGPPHCDVNTALRTDCLGANASIHQTIKSMSRNRNRPVIDEQSQTTEESLLLCAFC